MGTSTMKRWELEAVGRDGPHLRTVAVPEPGPGEVLVKVAAVSLNYRDLLVMESGMGLSLAFPFTPGSDLAGVVTAVGAGVRRFAVGEKVLSTFSPGRLDGPALGTARVPPYKTLGGAYPGVLAEYVAFPEDWFVKAPTTLDAGEASTLPCAGLTAWTALIENGPVRPGQTVLVQGTGGVALFGLQLARAQGADVIVTSGSDEKLARVKALGATHVIHREREDWVEAVYRITADRGVDHILELAGGPNLGRSIEAVALHGTISVIGVFEGFTVTGPSGPLLLKEPTIRGINVGTRRALESLVRAVDSTGLKPVIDARYPLEALPAALEHLRKGAFGKIVVESH
ncbi:zinc-dependent alcohol dehydrogenase family protein [Corallococcus exiguus]|uniref:zinc-dependent alcohol dehydrogenase family protein n=1 Tax=Corallococcus exiguus TaxID=83462 RepID=UPI0030B8142E